MYIIYIELSQCMCCLCGSPYVDVPVLQLGWEKGRVQKKLGTI